MLTAIPKKIPIIKLYTLRKKKLVCSWRKYGKRIILRHKTIRKTKVTSFLLVLIKAEMMFPTIAQMKETTRTKIEALGILSKVLMPISSIFCHMTVDTAQSMAMGTRSRKYFSVTARMLGMLFLRVETKGFEVKSLS